MKEIESPFLRSSNLIRLEARTGKDLPAFHIGQVLRGRVIKVMDDGHAVIRMEGRDLSVESRMPLSGGMEGFFKVKAIYPQIVLKLLQPEETGLMEAERWLKAFLMTDPSKEGLSEKWSFLLKTVGEGITPAVRETMDRLLGLWRSFSPSRSLAIDPAQIQEMITRSGLFFEHQLGKLIRAEHQSRFEEALARDVKGLLMKLKAQIEASSSAARASDSGSTLQEDLLDGVNDLLHRIEGAQLLHSRSSAGSQEKVFLLLPFWIEERLQLVDLCLSLPSFESDPSTDTGMSMLFLLHLPEWGKMSIEVRLTGKKLYGRFLLSSEEATSFFNGVIDELQSRLLRLGFQPEMRAFVQAPEKMVELFLNEMKGTDRSVLNLVV